MHACMHTRPVWSGGGAVGQEVLLSLRGDERAPRAVASTAATGCMFGMPRVSMHTQHAMHAIVGARAAACKDFSSRVGQVRYHRTLHLVWSNNLLIATRGHGAPQVVSTTLQLEARGEDQDPWHPPQPQEIHWCSEAWAGCAWEVWHLGSADVQWWIISATTSRWTA